MIFNLVGKGGGADIVPISMDVTGSWTNEQLVGQAPDTTGLIFTVTYQTKQVTPSVSPATYPSTGSQTVTFSFTENGTTVTATKTATVIRKPVSLFVSGSWTNTQYVGSAMDTTGLTFTVTYNNGSTATVTPTKSPSTWTSSGTQTATFTYTENGTTVSTTKTATVEQKVTPTVRKPVGGIIFYIDNTADGTYIFYNANDEEVSAPTVGTDCTGWTYMVEGASKDKYYVVYNQLYTAKRWCPYIDGAYVRVSTGYTATAIGSGKTNTAGIMAIDNGKYIQADSNGYPTVWYQIQQMRTNKVGGCDDWFVGSEYELDALRTSNAGDSATWFSGNFFIWSSSEASDLCARAWIYRYSLWLNDLKSTYYCVCGVRAF